MARFTLTLHADANTARGPQSLPAGRIAYPSCLFFWLFSISLGACICPDRKYTLGDAEWRLANNSEDSPRTGIPQVFASIHQQVSDPSSPRTQAAIDITFQCTWHRCLPACDVWREGILQYCRERRWRVRTAKDMLRDRFKKFKYDARRPEEFPLQPPKTKSAKSDSNELARTRTSDSEDSLVHQATTDGREDGRKVEATEHRGSS